MQLVHCSYHKCLTRYFKNIFNGLNDIPGYGYKHFMSRLPQFYEDKGKFTVSSVNNHFVDKLNFTEEVRLSRFIRDPRDLVVSGYFYHKRGAEAWTTWKNVDDKNWALVNGVVPTGMNLEESFSGYLNRVSLEDGLIAQIEFRKNHFESMRKWDTNNDLILLLKYEDILCNELENFSRLLDFYGFEHEIKQRLLERVMKMNAQNMQGKTAHIRNPRPGQWRDYFTEKVMKFFNERYEDIILDYAYSLH